MGNSNLSCFRNIKNRVALDRLCRVTFKGLRHFVWLVVIEFKHKKAKENHLIFLITLYCNKQTNDLYKKNCFVQNVCLKRVILYETHCTDQGDIGLTGPRSKRSVRERGMQWKEMTRGLLIELHLEFVNRNYLFTLNVASNQMSMSSFSCMLGRISLKSFSAFLF